MVQKSQIELRHIKCANGIKCLWPIAYIWNEFVQPLIRPIFSFYSIRFHGIRSHLLTNHTQYILPFIFHMLNWIFFFYFQIAPTAHQSKINTLYIDKKKMLGKYFINWNLIGNILLLVLVFPRLIGSIIELCTFRYSGGK